MTVTAHDAGRRARSWRGWAHRPGVRPAQPPDGSAGRTACGSVAAAAAVAPGLVVDEAAVVVAQGGGVVVVVPHVGAAVLVEVGAGVAAHAGVDADRGAAGQAVVVEGVAVAGLVARVQPSRLTALRVVLVSSTHSLFSERLERSSRPGESYWTAEISTFARAGRAWSAAVAGSAATETRAPAARAAAARRRAVTEAEADKSPPDGAGTPRTRPSRPPQGGCGVRVAAGPAAHSHSVHLVRELGGKHGLCYLLPTFP